MAAGCALSPSWRRIPPSATASRHPPAPDGTELPQQDAAEEFRVAQQFCRFAKVVYFPATIADIRYGLQKQQQANDLASATKQVEGNQHLSLESGAENGSEFPESQESALTSASDQLQLDRSLDELAKSAPRIIVVVATDVRDRLFLFDQLRARMPRALLIDLEADNLLTHPDFLHASRGALAVASADLMAYDGATFGCESPTSARIEGASRRTLVDGWPGHSRGQRGPPLWRFDQSAACPVRNRVGAPAGSAASGDVQRLQVGERHSQHWNEFTMGRSVKPLVASQPATAAHDGADLRADFLPGAAVDLAESRDPATLETDPKAAAGCGNGVAHVADVGMPAPVHHGGGGGLHQPSQTSHTLTYIVIAVEIIGLWGLWRCDRRIQICYGSTSTATAPILWLSAGLAWQYPACHFTVDLERGATIQPQHHRR